MFSVARTRIPRWRTIFLPISRQTDRELERADKECSRWRCIYYLCCVQKLARLSKPVRCSGRIIRLMCGCWYQSGRLQRSRAITDPPGKLSLLQYRLYVPATIVQAIKFNLFLGTSFLIDGTAVDNFSFFPTHVGQDHHTHSDDLQLVVWKQSVRDDSPSMFWKSNGGFIC